MKRFKAKKVYLAFVLIMAVFFILPGCGKGTFGGGHWDETFNPAVSSTNPVNGATSVPPGNKISATFNKGMAPATLNTTTFTLRHGATAVPGSVTYSGVTAVFTPASNLLAGTLYTATISAAVKDLDGTALANDYVWSFTTSGIFDNIAPTVTDTTNHNGAIDVAINSKAGATFSEAMDPATINSTTFVLRQGATVVPGSLTYSGVSAVFTPTTSLAYNTTYTGTITTGAKDLGGNALASNYVWSWTTGTAPDTTVPTVSSTLPVSGASPVAIGSRLTAIFSEKMDPLSINTGTFLLKQGNTPITGTVNYSGVTAVFTPASNLAYNTTYTATITIGAKDLADNPLAQNYNWSFTTGDAPYTDNIRPTVIGTINANGATGVAINTNAGATFSEAMDPLSITNLTFTLKQGLVTVPGTVSYSGVNAVFNPTNSLSANTTYTATITTGATDLYGNTLASNYVWSWTTGAAPDTIAPTITHTVPADVATGVLIAANVTATFSEAMNNLTITNVTFTLKQGLNPVAGTVSYDSLSKTATFDPTDPLLANTTYTATVSNVATDLAGNNLVVPSVNGLPRPNPWTFTTAAAAVPPANLLDLMSYGIASAGGITNTGATKINGNVVLDPNMTCNLVPILFADGPGFGLCGGNILNIPTVNAGDTVVTQIYPDTTTADAVIAQLTVKWNSISPALLPDATVLGCGTIGSTGDAGALIGCSGNSVLPPGTYISATGSTIGVAGDLTLNGGPTDVWYFQAPTALTTAVNSKIILTGGAKASNVWWFVGSSATINGGTEFNGNVLASAAITMGTGATSCGRLLAGAEGAGNFTFLGNTVSVPGHSSAPPACQ